MYRPIFVFGCFAAWLIVGCSMACAQTAAAPITTVAVLPLYTVAEPFILTAFGILFSALMTWAISELRRRTGLQISADAQAKFQTAATNAAGRILAAEEGNLANVKVDVHSAAVAAEASTVETLIPDALKTLNIHPDDVADVLKNAIAGKVGVLQSGSPQIPVPLPVTPATGAAQ